MSRRRVGLIATLAIVAGLALSACSSGGAAQPPHAGAPGPSTPTGSSSITVSPDSATPTDPASAGTSSSAPRRPDPGKPVHVSLFQGDGQTYGVGFAIIAEFDVAPTDSHDFTRAVTVTADGQPAGGGWFWQRSEIPGYKVEAIYRPRTFWPAHAKIHANLPLKGLSAGNGLTYADSLTLSIATGARNISTVDNQRHVMTVTSDGRTVHKMPVSLGAGNTPTYNGTKVVMQKGEDAPGSNRLRPRGTVRMKSSPGAPYYNLLVPWSVRITNSGEYVHAASWNTGNIGSRNTSHGCTNLDVAAAKWFYKFSRPGDIVQYPNANARGKSQPSWDGWGWWNLPWSQWKAGGLLVAR